MQEKQQEELSVPRRLTLKEIEEQAKARAGAARERKVTRAKKKRCVSIVLLKTIWVERVRKINPKYPSMVTKTDLFILQKHLTHVFDAGLDFEEYVNFLIDNWDRIMRNQFKWTTTPPPYPSIRFIVKFKDEFQSAFARKAEIEDVSIPAQQRIRSKPVITPHDKIETVSKSQDSERRIERMRRVRSNNTEKPATQTKSNVDGEFGMWDEN